MNNLNLADNMIRFRHDKKITQEQLAEFAGVTKASVSKWETKQTMPDIMLLPRLAAFFNVTVDELLGYDPQLSKEQIQKLYREFASKFSEDDFESVMKQTIDYVKRYISCYPFLFQMCILWLNHYNRADGNSRQMEVLESISRLCGHITANCKDVRLCSDASLLQANIYLMLGKVQEAIHILEELSCPYSLANQSDHSLGQAYLMADQPKKAERLIQINMYQDILSLMTNASLYLTACADNVHLCEETIRRMEQIIDVYELGTLNPNNSAAFEYQAALCYLRHGMKEKALLHITNYISFLQELFKPGNFLLHGDRYFTKLDELFEELDLGTMPPRDRKLVLEDVILSLEQPAFTILEGDKEFEQLKKKLKEIK